MHDGLEELLRVAQVQNQENCGEGHDGSPKCHGYLRRNGISLEIADDAKDESSGACSRQKQIGSDLPTPRRLRCCFHLC